MVYLILVGNELKVDTTSNLTQSFSKYIAKPHTLYYLGAGFSLLQRELSPV